MKFIKKILSFFFAAIFCVTLASCEKEDVNTMFFDDITSSFTLEKAYEGKSFLKNDNGIGEAKVLSYVDGDTTRFKLVKDSVQVVIRYMGINTPESTTKVQKWGKAASLFTKSRLSEATVVVLESSTGGNAIHDSYGERYLGYVWYKTADSDFKLLNCELVENGFSDYEGVDATAPYYGYFKRAKSFATRKKLRIHSPSKTVDPYFKDGYETITLADFYANEDMYYDETSECGAKVKVPLIITDLRIYGGTSKTYTYTGVEYPDDGSEPLTISVFTGYDDDSDQFKVGDKYLVAGTIDLHNHDWQLKGISYTTILSEDEMTDDYTVRLNRDYYFIFDSTKKSSDISVRCNTLYESLLLDEDAELNGNILSMHGTARRIKARNVVDNTRTYEFAINVHLTDAEASTINLGTFIAGKKLTFTGYQYEYVAMNNLRNIDVTSLSSITLG